MDLQRLVIRYIHQEEKDLPGAFSEFRTRKVPREFTGFNRRRSASFRGIFL